MSMSSSTLGPFHPPENDPEWGITINLGIADIRMMLSLMRYFHEEWPGSPKRPAEEQEFILWTINWLQRAVFDYQLYKME